MSESLRKSLDALPGDWAPRLSYTEYALNTSRVDGRKWTPLMAATMRATPSRAGRAGTEADLADEDVDALVAERLWLANELLLPALAAESAARAGARAEAWAKGKKITSPLEAGDLVVLDRPRLADGQEKLLRRFAGPTVSGRAAEPRRLIRALGPVGQRAGRLVPERPPARRRAEGRRRRCHAGRDGARG